MKKQKSVLVLVLIAVVAIALGSIALFHGKNEARRERSLIEPEREGNWDTLTSFYEQRAYPLETIPVHARQNALEQVEREVQRLRRSSRYASEFARIEADDQSWTPLGPKPLIAPPGDTAISYSGRVSAIALHPQYDGSSNKTIYVGAAQGGVWRSTDNGQTWTPLLDSQPTQAVGSLAIDPTNPEYYFGGHRGRKQRGQLLLRRGNPQVCGWWSELECDYWPQFDTCSTETCFCECCHSENCD